MKNDLVASLFCALLVFSVGVATAAEDAIPITTSSPRALQEYKDGRELAEKLRGQDAKAYFARAIAADSSFALAYLSHSFVQFNARAFFAELAKARALVDRVSEGERLWILGVEAGVNGFPAEQRALYQQLVERYPRDERAHNILGNHYFGQQQYAEAIVQYEKALALNPEFSPPYNQLGYAHRFRGEYEKARVTFSRYIELIPDDPNPYDSLAELLLKMGDYDQSIETYEKALSLDPHFIASHMGIAINFVYKGDYAAAHGQLKKLSAAARSDGERRGAHFVAAVSYVDEGKIPQALGELEAEYALAQRMDDATNGAGDLTNMGHIYLEQGDAKMAATYYAKALALVEAADLSAEIKDNARRANLYNSARVAIARGDYTTAAAHARDYRKRAAQAENAAQIRLANELDGAIALAQKNYEIALEALAKSNQQDSYNLYRMALAYEGKGDGEAARRTAREIVNFNPLASFNHAFVRHRAQRLLGAE